MADFDTQDLSLDDPSIDALFYRISQAEVAVVMAQRRRALMQRALPPNTYTTAELVEEARRSIKLADDMTALEGRWKF